jgi:hypothetical protein
MFSVHYHIDILQQLRHSQVVMGTPGKRENQTIQSKSPSWDHPVAKAGQELG